LRFEVLLVNKHAITSFLDHPLNNRHVIASKSFIFKYKNGKVNWIEFTNGGVVNPCRPVK